MSKRGSVDLKEVRCKLRKMQEEMAVLAPLLEEGDSSNNGSDSEESTTSSVLAFRALTKEVDKDEENKENSEKNAEPDQKEVPVDPEILDILGIEASKNKSEVVSIDSELIKIWKDLVNKGLAKEEKEQLLKNYTRIPELEAKKLNAEILASLAPKNAKKDRYMADLQKLAGSALMAVGSVLTLLMREDECDKLTFLKKISDMAKINIAIHHAISVTRRANIFIPDLTPQVAELIKKAEMDETLYGSNLDERIRESKALTKLSQDIKQKAPAKKPFLFRSPQQKKPFAANWGSYQGKPQRRSPLPFKSRQQHFSSQARGSRNSSSSSSVSQRRK